VLLAAIGDIEGDADALHYAFDAIQRAGIQTIVHTGNVLVGPRRAAADARAIELLRDRDVIAVQGRWDRRMALFERKRNAFEKQLAPEAFKRLAQTAETVSIHDVEFLRQLPKRLTREVDGCKLAVCHGSLTSQDEILNADTPLVKLKRQREIANADVVICGGAQQFFQRHIDNTLFVAPGPLVDDTGERRYAVIDAEQRPFTVSRS